MFDPNTLLLLAALATPPDSAAHVPSANDSVLASVVSPLIKPGDLVRVRSDRGATQGAASMVDPLGVRLRIDAKDIWSQPRNQSIGWSQIEGIDVHTAHARNATRIGATVGCLLGLVVMGSAVAYASSESAVGGSTIFIAYAGGAIAGACGGAIVGGALGSLLPSWKNVYERR